ncbi:MAG: glycerophosphodiester phosphodiesterase family protein, partial [Pirellulaceae bacterium]
MNRVYLLWLVSLANFLLAPAGRLAAQPASGRSPIVIAHRGSSGYLPEHTEGAKVLAVAQGADYVEQDVVLTRDRVFVVCHDVTLEGTTDVAERYPQRRRADGK